MEPGMEPGIHSFTAYEQKKLLELVFLFWKKMIFQFPSSSSFFLDSTSSMISKITLQLITQFNIHKEGDDIY